MTTKEDNGPVETKVTRATLAAFLASAVVGLIIKMSPWFAPLADVLEAILLAVITAGFTFIAGFFAKHTSRNDAGTRKTGTSDPIPPTDRYI